MVSYYVESVFTVIVKHVNVGRGAFVYETIELHVYAESKKLPIISIQFSYQFYIFILESKIYHDTYLACRQASFQLTHRDGTYCSYCCLQSMHLSPKSSFKQRH